MPVAALILGHVRRVGQDVAAVVEDLAVGVVGDDVLLVVVDAQAAHTRQLIVEVVGRELAAGVGVVVVERQDVVAGDELAEPPHPDHGGVELVGAAGRVVEQFREGLADWVGDDGDLGAGRRLELVADLEVRDLDRVVDALDGDLFAGPEALIAGARLRDDRGGLLGAGGRGRILRADVGGLQEQRDRLGRDPEGGRRSDESTSIDLPADQVPI